MTGSGDPPPATDGRILVHNPESGDADHDDVRRLASERGYDVRETESGDDVVTTAAEAAREASLVAGAGGDGTLTRVVRGLDEADAFDDTLFGVVPAGTGNNFASNVGVTGVEHGFDVIDTGERRRIDVGLVDGTPFLNSCVAGLTAEASAETDSGEKERWGELAYAVETVRTAREFEGIHLTVRPRGEPPVECDAILAFVGNARGFPRAGPAQAAVEDGLLTVAVVEDVSALELFEESIQAAIGDETAHVRHLTAAHLDVELAGTASRVSVDGEIRTASRLGFDVRERTLWLPVGEEYVPTPDDARDRD